MNSKQTVKAKERSGLPTGWTRLSMGEVGHWFGGGTPSKSNPGFWTNGTIPWVSPKDMKSDLITDAQDHITNDAIAQSATNLVEVGSVLIVVRSGILQHTLPVAVTQCQVALNQDLKAVKPRDGVRPEYLALALKAFEREILHTCTKTGTTVQSLEMPSFNRFEIPVAPIPEQKRIVAEIEKQFTRLEVGVSALRRVQANLKRYRAAVLKAACEGRLVPSDVTQWKGISLGEVVISMKNGIYKPRGAYSDDGIACLRMYNIENGKISWKKIKRMRLSSEESSDYGLLPGDLLVNRVNSRELVGKAAVIPVGLEPCVFESKNIRVCLKIGEVDPRFAHIALSAHGSAYFDKNAQQVVGMASISQPQIARFPLLLPTLIEQKLIAEEVDRRISVVEELEALVSANLQRANRLRQSILQKAFTGAL